MRHPVSCMLLLARRVVKGSLLVTMLRLALVVGSTYAGARAGVVALRRCVDGGSRGFRESAWMVSASCTGHVGEVDG